MSRANSNKQWRKLKKTVNKLNRINRVHKKPEASYREKAEMIQLKRSIDKLKRDLKEAQRSNLILEKQNIDLTDKLSSAESRLAAICEDLLNLKSTLSESVCDL